MSDESTVIREIETILSLDFLSITQIGKLEVLLDECFEQNDFVQETVEILAMYRPGGGEFLFDEAAVRKRLTATLAYIKAQSKK